MLVFLHGYRTESKKTNTKFNDGTLLLNFLKLNYAKLSATAPMYIMVSFNSLW